MSTEVLNPEPQTPDPMSEPTLAPAVRSALAALRWRIRRYVWLQGLATAIAWLGIAFWGSLGIDRLLEPPVPVRTAILGVAGLGLAWVFFRLIFRRAFARLTNRHMAMLLERRFPQFDESLLTAVELTDRTDDLSPHSRQMLAQTSREAAESIGDVRLGQVFNPVPLRRSTLAALLLGVSVWAFGWLAPEAFGIWTQRSLLLEDQLWPRNTRLIVEGFEGGVAKVARGDDLEVIAKADLSKPLVPKVVEVRYRTEGGARLRGAMSREGTVDPAKDRYQEYAYTFRGVLTPIRFDLVGGDDAVRDLRIEVVPSPAIVEMAIECEYPDYTDRPPRTLPVAGVMQIPMGTRITVRAKANKDLVQVEIDDGERIATIEKGDEAPAQVEEFDAAVTSAEEAEPRAGAPFRTFAFRLPQFTEDKSLLFRLFDHDGIKSRQPVRLALAAVADAPPQLSVELRGIGSAITPQARLPAIGRINDDYGISRVWFDYTIDQGEPVVQAIESPAGNVTDFPLDHALEVGPIQLRAGQKLLACVKAADRCDLAGEPNVGTSQRWLLDVVTPEQLRTMLQARELMLRQRFERIIQEVTETGDSLRRMQFDPAAPEGTPEEASDEAKETGGEPADEDREPDGQDDPSPQRVLARRTLRVQRATQNSRKNAHETLGVAEAFLGIRDELINNRIDTAELNARLQQGIAEPLERIADDMFPELERRLDRLEATLADDRAGERDRDLALAQVEAVLDAMQAVLDRMLELEDFNKAVELLREIIRAQERLGDRTRTRHKERLRELLED
ncbi:MAG TPA: hypothetical protein VMY37_25440 [Thermoguttaceae bacterium]|nr:hypothetical protein [Thermoguttaceae bacterium]